MNNRQIILLFLAMTAVTYIPRALPVLLLDRFRLGKKTEKFLKLIPYTAMSALIFPGVLNMDAERPWLGIVGIIMASLFALRKCPAVLCVLSAVGVIFGLYLVL